MLINLILNVTNDSVTLLAIKEFGFVAIVTVMTSFLASWAVYKYRHGALEVRVGNLEKRQELKDEQISALRGDVQELSGKISLLIQGKIRNSN